MKKSVLKTKVKFYLGNLLIKENYIFFLLFIHLFICVYIVCTTPPRHHSHFQAKPVLPSSPILLKRKQSNKKDIAFLLEIKIAIQRDSYHCFYAHVYYNPHWFISIRPLHYFPVIFP
jgi:hypothetical protein